MAVQYPQPQSQYEQHQIAQFYGALLVAPKKIRVSGDDEQGALVCSHTGAVLMRGNVLYLSSWAREQGIAFEAFDQCWRSAEWPAAHSMWWAFPHSDLFKRVS